MAGSLLIRDELESFKCSANEAIHFKLVRQESDVQNENCTFYPEMSHQQFGESESIFGFKNLQVQMYYSASRLTPYINLKYTDKVTPQKFDGIEADNVMGVLNKIVPQGYITSIDEFVASIAKDAVFKPFGEMIHAYKTIKDNEERHFEIYKTDISCPGFSSFHERLQTFIMFFIDAASFIDVDDDRWTFYLLFEKYKSNGNPMWATAGYMTVYNYYAYPEKIRPRVSQVLVLPPFQKMGHGAELVQTFYNDCQRSEVMDITVEDPSENFQRLRDYVDIKNCVSLPCFEKNKLLGGFSENMIKESKDKLKINKKQARRIYEILRLKATNTANPAEYKEYRLEIKRRLNIPFQKRGRDTDKLQKALKPDELTATVSLSDEQRLKYLENAFQEEVDMYQQVIDRYNSSV